MKELGFALLGILGLILIFCVSAYIIQKEDCVCHHAAYKVLDVIKN